MLTDAVGGGGGGGSSSSSSSTSTRPGSVGNNSTNGGPLAVAVQRMLLERQHLKNNGKSNGKSTKKMETTADDGENSSPPPASGGNHGAESNAQDMSNRSPAMPQLRCAECSITKLNTEELEVHIKMEHLNWLPFQCPTCLTSRASDAQMREHLYSSHKLTSNQFLYVDDVRSKRKLQTMMDKSLVAAMQRQAVHLAAKPPPMKARANGHHQTNNGLASFSQSVARTRPSQSRLAWESEQNGADDSILSTATGNLDDSEDGRILDEDEIEKPTTKPATTLQSKSSVQRDDNMEELERLLVGSASGARLVRSELDAGSESLTQNGEADESMNQREEDDMSPAVLTIAGDEDESASNGFPASLLDDVAALLAASSQQQHNEDSPSPVGLDGTGHLFGCSTSTSSSNGANGLQSTRRSTPSSEKPQNNNSRWDAFNISKKRVLGECAACRKPVTAGARQMHMFYHLGKDKNTFRFACRWPGCTVQHYRKDQMENHHSKQHGRIEPDLMEDRSTQLYGLCQKLSMELLGTTGNTPGPTAARAQLAYNQMMAVSQGGSAALAATQQAQQNSALSALLAQATSLDSTGGGGGGGQEPARKKRKTTTSASSTTPLDVLQRAGLSVQQATAALLSGLQQHHQTDQQQSFEEAGDGTPAAARSSADLSLHHQKQEEEEEQPNLESMAADLLRSVFATNQEGNLHQQNQHPKAQHQSQVPGISSVQDDDHPLECRLCNKFMQNRIRGFHILWHLARDLGMVRYTCKVCGFGHDRSQSVLTHARREHGVEDAVLDNIDKYKKEVAEMSNQCFGVSTHFSATATESGKRKAVALVVAAAATAQKSKEMDADPEEGEVEEEEEVEPADEDDEDEEKPPELTSPSSSSPSKRRSNAFKRRFGARRPTSRARREELARQREATLRLGGSHYLRRRANETAVCEKCDLETPTKLSEHVTRFHLDGVALFRCRHCEMGSQTRDAVARHHREAHSSSETPIDDRLRHAAKIKTAVAECYPAFFVDAPLPTRDDVNDEQEEDGDDGEDADELEEDEDEAAAVLPDEQEM